MTEVLVLADHADGAIRSTSLELLTIARRLGRASAIFIGRDESEAVETLSRFGAETIYIVDPAGVDDYLVAPKAEILAQLVESAGIGTVMISSTVEGKEIAARLAVKIGSGLITDAVDVLPGPIAIQSAFAGNYTVTSQVTKGVPIITVKPNATTPEEAPVAAVVERFSGEVSASAKGARITASSPRAASGRPELTEASVVVSGGRGTGGNFQAVEQFADVLGAAVGASRAAVDSGWYPHSFQVGQTGKTVSPQLYVAAGISGAIQHRAGMRTAKSIIAVNTDAEAPIFELADLAIVGDLHAILPSAVDLMNQRQPS